jgi:signal peptidase II
VFLEQLRMPSRQGIEVAPFFNMVMVWNSGISFGMFAGKGMNGMVLLTVGTSLMVLLLIEWMRRAPDHATALALAAIIGGACGNIVDRLRFGAVADFFDFHWGRYHWPAFNVADACIFLGVVVLAWGSIFARNSDAPPDAGR